MVIAKKIIADEVTDVQVEGGGARGAKEIGRALGSADRVRADEIRARSVAGFRYVADPQHPQLGELRDELARLREEISAATGAGAPAEVLEAEAVLVEAQEELAKPEPRRELVLPKLEKAARVLTGGAKVVDAAGKLGDSLAKWGPLATALVTAAGKLFGA